MSNLPAPDLHELVPRLLDSAESPEGFAHVLGALSHQLGAAVAHTFVIENAQRVVETSFHGYDEKAFASYEDRWRDKDPRFIIGLAAPDRFHSDVDVVDSDAFDRSPIYNEFLTTFDLRYTLFGVVRCGPGLDAAAAFMRPRASGPFSAEELRRIHALQPWMARALRLRNLVRSLRNDLNDLQAALDAAPGGLAVLDVAGKLVCANAETERLIAANDGLKLLSGSRLTAERELDAQQLSRAILTAESFSDPLRRGSKAPSLPTAPSLVRITREQKPPLEIVVLPLRPHSELRIRGTAEARVLVVIHDPSRAVTLNASLLMGLYDLTPTEAALAASLAAGKTLAAFALVRRCSEETVRTHLKRLLQKTGTGRQGELVSVLLGASVLHQVRSP